jgi:hypothetical protein
MKQTMDNTNSKVKVQPYAKTNLHNDSCKLKIIMAFKIYMNNEKIPSRYSVRIQKADELDST